MSDTDTTAPAEQAADLAALQAAAAEGTGPAAVAGQVEQDPPGLTLAQELAGLVTVAVAALGPFFPSLRGTYTPEVTQAAAEAVARVCEKHGWLGGGLMGKWGEEVAAAMIVGPLAWQTAQGIRADLAARQAAEKKPERIGGPDLAAAVPAEVPGQKTVTFGAPAAAEAAP